MPQCKSFIVFLAGCLVRLATYGAAGDQLAASFEDPTSFSSLAQGLNFKVSFRVQSLVDGKPAALIDLRESYHSSLAAGLIKQTVLKQNPRRPWRLSRDQRKIFYDAEIMRLVEYHGSAKQENPLPSDQDELLGDDFFLYENGGSNGYARTQDDNASHRQWQQHSARLIPAGESLDALMLLAGLKTSLVLDFSDFMRPKCVQLIKQKLHHVNGLMRLLLMIECRRREFSFKQQPGAGTDRKSAQQMTRGLERLVYAAPNLRALNNNTAGPRQMEVMVTIQSANEQQQEAASNTLPENRVPLSVVLSLKGNEQQEILLIVNVFQFEIVGPLEHVSESSSDAGHSRYLMPLNQLELNHLRSAVREKQDSPIAQATSELASNRAKRDQFSFRATITMSRGGRSSLLSDPIELVVLYDGRAALLAAQMEFVDRTKSSGPMAGWHRDQVRTLYDGQSNTKYHLMRSNFNYNNRDELGQERDDSEPLDWRACASDTLDTRELQLIEQGAGDLFDVASATFMGTALVRGILCHVFEKRLHELPQLLGLSMGDYIYMRSFSLSEIYAQIYVAASQQDGGQFLARQMASDADKGKFARLDVRLMGRLSGEMASFRLEIHSFDWSTHLLKDVPDLLTGAAQACLATNFRSRHADLQLDLELDGGKLRDSQLDKRQTEAIVKLSEDSSLLQTSFSQLLVDSMAISWAQQVDLEVELGELDRKRALGKQLELRAKLSLFEGAREQLAEQLIGYAQFLSPTYARPSLSYPPNLGARVYSYDECRWRAAHTLIPKAISSSGEVGDDSSWRPFLFCPHSLLCVLGDASWKSAQSERRLHIENLLKFPYPSDQPLLAEPSDRCALAALSLRDSPDLVSSWRGGADQFLAGARSHLDWLEAQRPADFRRLRDLPLELKVAGLEGNCSASLPLAVKRAKVSRLFNAADGTQATSLLVKPLSGLGYATGGQQATSESHSERVTEPLMASSLAKCARNCLLLHNCNSYSACHAASGQLACLFSSLDWSQAVEFERLRSLARTKRSSSGQLSATQAQIEIQLAGERVQVQLRRSKLCSLYARPQVELFKARAFALAGHKPAAKFQLPAQSAEKCARFCQERAHLARQLVALAERSNSSVPANSQLTPELLEASRASLQSQSLTKFRVFACRGFLFSAPTSACRLLPMLDHWSLLGLGHLLGADSESSSNSKAEKQLELPDANQFKTVERWRAQLRQTPVASWLKREQANFKPPEHFELDFEQLFIGQRGRRIKLDENRQLPAGGRKLQLKIFQLALADCAGSCMSLVGCRSFDFLNSVSTGLSTVCVLSSVAGSDLASEPTSWPMLEFASESQNSSSSIWWHYEPSELASFMLAEPHESDGLQLGLAAGLLHADAREEADPDPVLLQPADSKLLATLLTARPPAS